MTYLDLMNKLKGKHWPRGTSRHKNQTLVNAIYYDEIKDDNLNYTLLLYTIYEYNSYVGGYEFLKPRIKERFDIEFKKPLFVNNIVHLSHIL